ncbi:hypothetical protein SSX86_017734 [Deinandra increscens subsp. villosa]|uniref:Protein JASON n=1 Tax=Deinandra increscens subsp. villosa TaxID=3103831 RepID=A0AAP0D0L9_9ASTR
MLFSSFSCEFVEFLRRAMGCFSCCFRIKDDHRTQINRFSQPITAVHKEPVDHLASNCVWSLLPREDEDGDLSQCEDGRCGVTGSVLLEDELRAEVIIYLILGFERTKLYLIQANFLKACGTLPKTPVEIRKMEKSKDSKSHNGDTESTFNSRLPNAAIEEQLQKQPDQELQKQPDQLQSPVDLFQKWEDASDSSSHSSNSSSKPSVLYLSSKNTDSNSSNSVDGCGIVPAASTQCKNKSVHFESQSDSCSFSSKSSSPEIVKVPLKLHESPFDHTNSKPTPYPTPLKLTDDMQTPGTVFPSYGKNSRIRVQYLSSGIDPRNFLQLDTPIEEEYIEQSDKESPQSQVKLQESTTKNELNTCLTLSSWLPPKSNLEGCIDQSLAGQTPGDRPILGVVTSDWNADEVSFTPRWGDGNGIPNTTNKYSENQKVSWHATPFEERLEKALLEDNSIPKMKQLGETKCVEF